MHAYTVQMLRLSYLPLRQIYASYLLQPMNLYHATSCIYALFFDLDFGYNKRSELKNISNQKYMATFVLFCYKSFLSLKRLSATQRENIVEWTPIGDCSQVCFPPWLELEPFHKLPSILGHHSPELTG